MDSTKLKLAERSGNLNLAGCNLFSVPQKVFSLKNLARLDLSNNNLKFLPQQISQLTQLTHLWVNDNPLESVPVELEGLKNLQSLDLSRTLVKDLPRELANVSRLVELNLEGCPLKPSLEESYRQGITGVWDNLNRKVSRRYYKGLVFKELKENIYPGKSSRLLKSMANEVFMYLKDLDLRGLKLFYHNLRRVFPTQLEDFDPESIRDKLNLIYSDLETREKVSNLSLKLKSKYPQTDIQEVSDLAKSFVASFTEKDIQSFFKRKMLPDDFRDIDLNSLTQTLTTRKEKLEFKLSQTKNNLLSKLKNSYEDAEYEKLQELAEQLAGNLKTTKNIVLFMKSSERFLPQTAQEIDPGAISEQFLEEVEK